MPHRASPGSGRPDPGGPGLSAGSRLRESASAQAYVAGWRLVRLLPEPAAYALFDRIATRVYAGGGASVRRLRANLARAVPETELDAVTEAGVRSYLRYWCESFRLPSWDLADLLARTRIVREYVLRDAYAAGDGVVIALPHMGNWDWAGAWACAEGMPLMTVAERLRPERLYDEFVAYRSGLGMHVLPLGEDGVTRRLTEWVTDGGLVCLLADRDLSRAGASVTLLGEPASMPRGPAQLALRTGAPLVPATLHHEGREMVVTFHEPVPHDRGDGGDVRMMQGVADVFSDAFREHPVDWHMMQRVFLADLDPARGPAAAAPEA
ncbi:MAG: phosphatidylinositol mannoside acyltransferase [Nocardioides sp.]|nr:phosphatidylinositol mannoside acyltransferase [Nocardioides sp.]